MSQTVFFTSDTHFGHKSILTLGGGRPFASVDEMNEVMIDRWNSVVGQGDHIYHLGDFSFMNRLDTEIVIRRLHGNIHIVRGNHDSVLDSLAKTGIFASFSQIKNIKVGEQAFVLCHFPMLSWDRAARGSWHLHGHCHQQLDPSRVNGPMLDVGVDGHDFAPWSIDEVTERLNGIVWVPVDHHIRKDLHGE